MKIFELADLIVQGKLIEPDSLTSAPSNFLYLLPLNIKNNVITEEGAKYIVEKVGRKFYKTDYLSYGDIVIYHKSDDDFGIFRFTQELNKQVILSQFFVVIKSPNSFLSNTLQTEAGKNYFRKEIQDIWKHKESNWRNVMEEIKNIDISPLIDEGEIMLPPGNIPVSKNDFEKISIRKGFISADNLIKRVNRNEIKISGYFQRKTKLWDDGTKSRLIETLLVDIPIPPLYFDVVSKNDWLVIDGLQRISTIVDFYNNKFELTELDFLPELNGKYFRDLERDFVRAIEENELTTFSIQPGTPRVVRYKIFKNINTSALILERQEIRHAMNEDEKETGFTPSRYVHKLAEVLNKYIDIPQSEKNRMYDRELALRYVTFRMFFYKSEYKPSMADFLDLAMENMYSYPKNKLEVYLQDFNVILNTLTIIFEKDILFTKKMIARPEEEEVRTVVNGSLLETWTYAVGSLSPERVNLLIRKADLVRNKSTALGDDQNFVRSIDSRYSNAIEMVRTRFTTIINLVNEAINDKQY